MVCSKNHSRRVFIDLTSSELHDQTKHIDGASDHQQGVDFAGKNYNAKGEECMEHVAARQFHVKNKSRSINIEGKQVDNQNATPCRQVQPIPMRRTIFFDQNGQQTSVRPARSEEQKGNTTDDYDSEDEQIDRLKQILQDIKSTTIALTSTPKSEHSPEVPLLMQQYDYASPSSSMAKDSQLYGTPVKLTEPKHCQQKSTEQNVKVELPTKRSSECIVNRIPYSRVGNSEPLAYKYSVSDDGACLFRAHLAIKYRDLRWCSDKYKSKAAVFAEMERSGMCALIREAFQEALTDLVEIQPLPDSCQDRFRDLRDLAELFYQRAFGQGRFTYCIGAVYLRVLGVAEGANEENWRFKRESDEQAYANTYADILAYKIIDKLGIDTKIDASHQEILNLQKPYAYKYGGGSIHYDLIAPANFFFHNS